MTTMMTEHSLRDVLYSDEANVCIEECIQTELDDVDEAMRDALRMWINTVRDEIMESFIDVDDVLDRQTWLALKYIEMKCSWIMLNTTIQYRLFRTGVSPSFMMYKASLIGQILVILEKLIVPEDIDKITDFLANPVDAKNPPMM